MVKIVILGSNFAGIDVAKKIKKKLPEDEVIVYDMNPFAEFHASIPGLLSDYQKSDRLKIDLHEMYAKRGIDFRNKNVISVDIKKKEVNTKGHSTGYDFLVNALGSKTNYYGIPGAEENSIPFNTIEDVNRIKGEIDRLNGFKNEFTIIVAGSGLKGVELVFDIKKYVKQTCRRKKVTIEVIEAQPTVCSWTNDKAQKFFINEMQKCGIVVKTKFMITKVERNKIISKSHEEINHDLLVWCAGIKINPVIEKSGLDSDIHGMEVDKYLRSTTDPTVFGCGDAIKKPMIKGCPAPPSAHLAMVEADIVAKNIIASLNNKPLTEYKLKDSPPSLVSMGHRGSVIILKGKLHSQPRFLFQTAKHMIESWWMSTRKK